MGRYSVSCESGFPELVPNTCYPSALASKLTNENQLSGNTHDITISFKSNALWYYGPVGECPSDLYDIRTAALKAIAQGLGLRPGMLGSTTPQIYDRFVAKPSIPPTFLSSLVPYIPNNGGPYYNFMTNPAIAWYSSTSSDAHLAQIHTNISPSDALYFLKESAYPYIPNMVNNSLMTRDLKKGEQIHNPGPIAIGMLKDIGWDDNTMVGFSDELIIHGFNWQAYQNANNGWSDGYLNSPPLNVSIGDHLAYAYQFIDNYPLSPLAFGTATWKLEVRHDGGWYQHVISTANNANLNGKIFDFVLDDLPLGYNWYHYLEGDKVQGRIVFEINDAIGGYTNKEVLDILINYKPNKPTLAIANQNSMDCNTASLSFFASGAENYTILHKKLEDVYWTATAVPQGSTNCNIYGLLEDKKYLFVVGAMNAFGEAISDPALRDNCKFSVISYPNPAIGDVKVTSLDEIALEKAEVRKLNDPNISRTEYGDGFSKDIDVQMQNLPSGLYKLEVKDMDGKSSSQIIIKF